MDKLLKEAIADARQIRAAALATARISLEESLQESVSNTISGKLQREFEDPTPADGHGKAEGGETDFGAVKEQAKLDSSDIANGDNKQPADAAKSSSKIDNPGQEVDALGDGTSGADPKIGGKNPAPNGSDAHPEKLHEDDFSLDAPEDEEGEEGEEDGLGGFGGEFGDEFGGDEEENGEEELDLESIIRELEAELGISSGPVVSEDESDLAKRDNIVQTIDNPDKAPSGTSAVVLKLGESEDADADDVDLDEILREMAAEDDKGPMAGSDPFKYAHVTEKLQTENTGLKRQLKEYRDVVIFLKQRINEVNMLNAQLLFTNKIFKNYNLNLGQKKHIVEAFDRASTLREVKLVYTTLIETLTNSGVARVSKSGTKQSVKSITEGLASKPVGSTKPKTEVINESDAIVQRFQKLAGIKKQ